MPRMPRVVSHKKLMHCLEQIWLYSFKPNRKSHSINEQFYWARTFDNKMRIYLNITTIVRS